MSRRSIFAYASSTSLLALPVLLLGACQVEDPTYVEPPSDCTAVEAQNQFVVDVMRQNYLWSDSVPEDIDITAYEDPSDLVRELRDENDRWTRISDKSTSDALFMEGKFVGLGYKTQRMEDDSIRISFVSDNSPASMAGILRGDRIVGAGGYTVAELDEGGLWSEAYGSNDPGVVVELEIEHLATGESEVLTITKDWIDIVSIPVVETFEGPDDTVVGYFVMDKFVGTTHDELDAAYAQFKEAGVTTVVMDLRYNGGGLISVAERSVSLLLGVNHEGEEAYRFEYNDYLGPTEDRTADIDRYDNSLPTEKVIVITSGRTLSASELVINALFPYVDVTLVGSTTGGKPVGSRSYEFCEKLLYPVSFRLVNADGQSDYFDGLSPDCEAADDVFHFLGDPEEGMLAAALGFIENDACAQPAPPSNSVLGLAPFEAVGERTLPNPEARYDVDSW